LSEIANGYVGRALPGIELKICDGDGKEVPNGHIGEITVSGSFCIKSYFRMPEEDRASFTNQGWVKTGDLGYLADDGGLYVQGREKNIIRVGSYTVLPMEIEEVVMERPEIAVAAAIGMPDKLYGEEIWLYIVPEAGETIDENQIMEHCRKKLTKFKVPKKLFVRDSIPLTRIGKVDSRALKEKVMKSL